MYIIQIKDNYGPNLDSLSAGHTVGVMVDGDSCLHLLVNNVDQVGNVVPCLIHLSYLPSRNTDKDS